MDCPACLHNIKYHSSQRIENIAICHYGQIDPKTDELVECKCRIIAPEIRNYHANKEKR